MQKITKDEFGLLLSDFQDLKVLVVGDLIIDKWTYLKSERLSQEAPVPLTKFKETVLTLGGAGNVCRNLELLKAKTHYLGVVGHDSYTDTIVSELFRNSSTIKEHFVFDNLRINTIKERFIVDHQHHLRVDREDNFDVNLRVEKELIDKFDSIYQQFDAIILQDYNKGVLTPNFISHMIYKANQSNIKVYVEPKEKNIESYSGCWLFKPNRKEFERMMGLKIERVEWLLSSSHREDVFLWKRNKGIKNLLLTLGELGIILFLDNNTTVYCNEDIIEDVPVDVTGAGDVVISMFTLLDLIPSVSNDTKLYLSLLAAQIAIQKRGTSVVNVSEILEHLPGEI
jgi:D-beta-D-heptose 7-phosphate kinase / D-beta-D-heptose 1-phosphate adenosyltransferase